MAGLVAPVHAVELKDSEGRASVAVLGEQHVRGLADEQVEDAGSLMQHGCSSATGSSAGRTQHFFAPQPYHTLKQLERSTFLDNHMGASRTMGGLVAGKRGCLLTSGVVQEQRSRDPRLVHAAVPQREADVPERVEWAQSLGSRVAALAQFGAALEVASEKLG